MHLNKKKVLRFFGIILTIIAFIFIIYKVISFNIDYSILFDSNKIVIFFWSMLLLTILVMGLYYPWYTIVGIYNRKKTLNRKVHLQALMIYNKANIFKYVPGNVFQYIGRNELAVKCELNHTDVAISTITEIVLLVLTSLCISFLFLGEYFFVWMNQMIHENIRIWFILFFVFVGIILFLVIFLRKKIFKYVKNYKAIFSVNNLWKIFRVIIYYLVYNFCCALLYIWILNTIMPQGVPINLYGLIIGSFVAATTAGFITPGAPGGIGIREATITLLLGNFLPQEKVLLAIVIYRFINIMADFLAYLFSLIIFKYCSKLQIYKEEFTDE